MAMTAALAFGLAAPARAQQEGEWGPTGRNIDPMNERALGDATTWRIVDIVSNCMAGQNPRTTYGLLATVPESNGQLAAFLRARTLIERCMRPALRLSTGNGLALSLPPFGYRGLFAEAMLRRLPAWNSAATPRPGTSLIRHFEQDPTAAEVASKNRTMFIFYDAAACAVRQDWAGVSRLLRTPPRSAEEAQALRSLSGTISGCIQPSVRVAIEPRSFRGVLAESALYALAPENYTRRPQRRSR